MTVKTEQEKAKKAAKKKRTTPQFVPNRRAQYRERNTERRPTYTCLEPSTLTAPVKKEREDVRDGKKLIPRLKSSQVLP